MTAAILRDLLKCRTVHPALGYGATPPGYCSFDDMDLDTVTPRTQGAASSSGGSGRLKASDRWRAFGAGDPLSSDVRLSLPARAENIAVVRHVIGALLESLGVPERLVEDIRLAVTEACTNVVRHAYVDGPGPVEVIVRPAEDHALTVIVADRGRGITPGASPSAEGPGLGLPLIAALTDGLEIQHSPETGSRLAMSFRLDRIEFQDAA